ncbi:hypothetical protein CJP55_02060 [Lactobacillus plantarum]|nr:hypothetical protein [Lactiplantibacillus plantarum]
MSPSPSSREATRMADERPLNLVQLVADYFDNGTLNKGLGCVKHFIRSFNLIIIFQSWRAISISLSV